MRPTPVVALALLLLVALPATAHAGLLPGITVVGGVSLTDYSLDPDPAEQPDLAVGAFAGLWLDVPFAGPLSFSPGFQFVQKELKFSGEVFGTTTEITARPDLLEIPLLLKIRAPVPIVSPWFAFGPAFGIKLGEGSSANFGTFSVTGTEDVFWDIDFSLHFLGGLEIGGPVVGFVVGGGYALGLIDISDDEDFEAKTRSILVFGGLTVKL